MKQYALLIDHEACWGCRTCEVACKQENGAAEGINLIRVSEDGPTVVDGKPFFMFLVNVCQHCDDPPCAEECPEEAIARRPDGLVVMDYQRCTGCALCVDACPYNAISFDQEGGVAQKCNLCHHRVDQGLVPACADNVCPAHCIYFGHPDELSKIRASSLPHRKLPE